MRDCQGWYCLMHRQLDTRAPVCVRYGPIRNWRGGGEGAEASGIEE